MQRSPLDQMILNRVLGIRPYTVARFDVGERVAIEYDDNAEIIGKYHFEDGRVVYMIRYDYRGKGQRSGHWSQDDLLKMNPRGQS